MPGALLTPRPMPERRTPVVLGGAVVALALPIFLLARVGIGEPTLRGSGIAAFGMMGRGIALVLVLLAVAVVDPSLALAGALVYAAAYSTELVASLALYFSGSPRR